MALGRLRWISAPGQQFSHRVMSAGVWAAAMRVVMRALVTLRTIILARLLAPEDFGLMGIALIIMTLLQTLTKTGFRNALIQRQENIRPYLDTAWTLEVLRGALLVGLLFLAAPLVAGFFSAPEAEAIVQVTAIALFIQGLRNIGIVYFEKELNFKRRFGFQLSQTITEVGVGIGLALALQSVWALVLGILAGRVMGTVMSYVMHSYRPRPRLEWLKAQELYRFGRWTTGSNILTYSIEQADSLVVGRLLGAATLGFYRMATNLSQLVSLDISNVLNQVMFPTFSNLQHARQRLQRAYLEALQLTSFASFPLATGMIVLAPDLVQVVLGAQWLPMIAAFQILTVWGLIRSVDASTKPLLEGVGRPQVATRMFLARLAMMAVLVVPMALAWGMLGAAVAVVLARGSIYPLNVIVVLRELQLSGGAYLKHILCPALCSMAMAGVLLTAGSMGIAGPSVVGVLTSVVLGAAIYLVSAAVFEYFAGYGPGHILLRRGWLSAS